MILFKDIADFCEAFEEKMKLLTGELSEQFKKSHDLEVEIKKNLKGFGYEIQSS